MAIVDRAEAGVNLSLNVRPSTRSNTDEFVVLTADVVDDRLTLFWLCGGDGMRRDGAIVDVNAMLLLDALPSLSSFI